MIKEENDKTLYKKSNKTRLKAARAPAPNHRCCNDGYWRGIGGRMLGWTGYFCDGLAVDKRTAGVILYIHRRVFRPEPSDFRAVDLNKERLLRVK